MLGIMYCGYMFLATSLLSVYCPLLHRPLRQYGAVRLDSDIMGELKESRAYRHHDSHDGLCRYCHRRRQHRHSHQQDARTLCWLSPMKTGFAKQLKRAFILHSQIVSSYAVALVKQLLIGAGNRCRPCGFHHLFRGTHCLSVFASSKLFSLSSSPLLSSPLLSSRLSLSLPLCLSLSLSLSRSLSLSLSFCVCVSVSASVSVSVSGVRAVFGAVFAVTDGGKQNDVVLR